MNEDQLATCLPCSQSPKGEAGHSNLRFYVGGPYPGHHIFKCDLCGERWIRHYGGSLDEPHAWTRFADQFPLSRRTPVTNFRPGTAAPA